MNVSRLLRRMMLPAVLFALGSAASAQTPVTLKLLGTETEPTYAQQIVLQSLAADGYQVTVQYAGDAAGAKAEAMLANGDVSALIMGQTADRDGKFLPVRIPMTNNLIGKRILFIPKGAQKDYDGVKTLADFQKLGKVAGMGKNWYDVQIWKANKLPVLPVDGDWNVLFKMVESKSRGVDYIPRGANEMIKERTEHPELDMEKKLVLVYQRDQILYVSPKEAALKPILEKALKKAQTSGLMKKLVGQFYSLAFEPPIDADARVVIDLTLP